MNPRDSIVLYTDLDDQRDKLAVDSRKYCQLSDYWIYRRYTNKLIYLSTLVDWRRFSFSRYAPTFLELEADDTFW